MSLGVSLYKEMINNYEESLPRKRILYKRNRQNFCPNCQKNILNYSIRCIECDKKNRQDNRKFNVSKKELEQLLKTHPITSIGKMFKVSDSAIRKRAKILDIKIPKYPPGYWLRK